MTKTTGHSTITRVSDLPGLSPLGRNVIAYLLNKSRRPDQIREAIQRWERVVRDPAHRLQDSSYKGCGIWECCPPWHEVPAILAITGRRLPRRLQAELVLW